MRQPLAQAQVCSAFRVRCRASGAEWREARAYGGCASPPALLKLPAQFLSRSQAGVTDAFRPRSDFLRVMQERGYVHQCSDLAGLDDKARSGSLVAYIGFDCTAPSLHVGSLVQIMMLHWLQETGGKPVALMGGGTTIVGAPP